MSVRPVPRRAWETLTDLGAGVDAAHGRTMAAVRRSGRTVVRVLGRVLPLAIVLGIGIAARTALVLDTRLGHADMDIFTRWARELSTLGLREFYAAGGFCDYPPLSMLIVWLVGWVATLLNTPVSDTDLYVLLKIPACLADVAIAVMIFIEARRIIGPHTGLPAAALFFLNPYVIYDSAYWGQVDSVYAALVLASLLLVGRGRWGWAGATASAALLVKFQSISLMPLILFETYRLGGWRGLARMLVGAVVLAAILMVPFGLADALDNVLLQSYVNVIGQYDSMAKGAYNIWQFASDASASDTRVPSAVLQIAAPGEVAVPVGASWLLHLSWRKISLVWYVLAVAVVISVYSLRPGPVARYGAAGLLSVAFFLFPTEMHERYAFIAIVALAIWALADPWKERLYYALSAMMLLNLAAVFPAAPLAAYIGAANLLIFVGILVALLWPRATPAAPAAPPDEPEVTAPRRLIPLFRWLTVGGVCAGIAGGIILVSAARAAAPPAPAAGTTYLSDLRPRAARQGWKTLAPDHAVSGGLLHLGDTYYRKGLGTHAQATLVYDVPEGATTFATWAGIDGAAGDAGSAQVKITVDRKLVYESPVLTGGGAPVAIELPVAGAQRLTIHVDPTGDGQRSDHVSLALARFQ